MLDALRVKAKKDTVTFLSGRRATTKPPPSKRFSNPNYQNYITGRAQFLIPFLTSLLTD